MVLTDYELCKGCKVHRGFYKMWNDQKEQVIASIYKLVNKYPNAKLAVTGHSLGAALTCLAVGEFSNLGL